MLGWRGFALTALTLVACPSTTQAGGPPVATFDHVTYAGSGNAPMAPLRPHEYSNPVLPGFQPDPSIVRVGGDFYLVNSTFGWFPGLPIYHSRDLVHWRQIGNAIDRPGQVPIGRLGVTRGLFAPAISHHDGRFYILNTCVDCGGNFIVTADNPAGPWSNPHWLEFSGIDPSLFVDDDGRAWIAYNDAPPGKPEYEGHRALWLQEIDLRAFRLIGGRVLLVDKGVRPADKPVWAEGPHIFKADGHYYLTAAEGGTADQHSQTIYRAEAVGGPYRPGPRNPILTQRDLPDERPWPIQATGHAEMLQIADGSWWAVFLATRPYADQKTNLGRETFLLPVSWSGGWPTILPPATPVAPIARRPALPNSTGDALDRWRDDFRGTRLSPDWLMLRTPSGTPWWRASRRSSGLQLTARPVAAGSLDQPSFLGRRLRHPTATVETRMTFQAQAEGDRAGLLALIDENHFLFLGVERLSDGRAHVVLRRRGTASEPEAGVIVQDRALPAGDASPIGLRMRIDRSRADLSWRPAGRDGWTSLATDVDASVLASIGAGLFTGTVIGPYAARASAPK